MNILLTSHGLDFKYYKKQEEADLIINHCRGKKVAIIPNAKLPTENRGLISRKMDVFKENDICCELFDLDEQNINELENYEAIYLAGGMPNYLMNSIIQNDAKNILTKVIKEKLIIGQSAGAMVLGKKSFIYKKQEFGYSLEIFNCLDIFDKIVCPHFSNLDNKLQQTIINKTGENLLTINDGDLYKLTEKGLEKLC